MATPRPDTKLARPGLSLQHHLKAVGAGGAEKYPAGQEGDAAAKVPQPPSPAAACATVFHPELGPPEPGAPPHCPAFDFPLELCPAPLCPELPRPETGGVNGGLSGAKRNTSGARPRRVGGRQRLPLPRAQRPPGGALLSPLPALRVRALPGAGCAPGPPCGPGFGRGGARAGGDAGARGMEWGWGDASWVFNCQFPLRPGNLKTAQQSPRRLTYCSQ